MPRIDNHPVRLLRLAKGLGQKELADRSGMNRSSISALEEGRTKSPGPENLARMASALGVSTEELDTRLFVFNRDRSVTLTNQARAVLALSPAEVDATFSDFVAWRKRIAPSPTAFASLLGLPARTVRQYENGVRVNGMPDSLASAIFTQLAVSADYLLAVQKLEPREEL